MKADGYIVVYDNGEIESPYGWDPECPGALQYGQPVVLFPDRRTAQRAVRISTAKAKLDLEQGELANDDFLPACRKNVKVVPVVRAQ